MDNNQSINIPIKGMHCKSCEILIEDELGEIKGISGVKANWQSSSVQIRYEGVSPDETQIKAAISRAGYKLGQDGPTKFFSTDKNNYRNLGYAFLALVVLYFLLKALGVTNLNVNTSGSLTLPLILLIGLTAGFSTCMALVGGLVLGISSRYNQLHPNSKITQKLYPHLLFNLGRFLSYTILGGFLGLLGSAFQLSSVTLGVITIIVGLIMLIMGLQLIKIFPWMEKVKLVLPKKLVRDLGFKERQAQTYSHRNSLWLGALTFFLPCGFTQAMQVYAIGTGNFWGGALVMGAFALGTIPGLLSVGGISAAVKGKFAPYFFSLVGLVVLVFALINISNGLNLAGADFSSQPTEKNTALITDPNVTLEDGVQVVQMTENSEGYSPNSFTIQKGVPVKWIVKATAPYSCASVLLLPKYQIRKFLTAGENVINFTPTEAGKLPFSCSMGMYKGSFNVVE